MLKIPHVSRDLSIAISVLPNPHEKKNSHAQHGLLASNSITLIHEVGGLS